MKLSLAAILAVSLATCANAGYQPVPEGYPGPVATVVDTGIAGSSTAQIFAAVEIDGKPVQNSFVSSARASSGQGFALTTRFIERQVPVRTMTVKIRGGDATAAPALALILGAAGKLHSVEGVVSFTPIPGHKYFVVGILKPSGSTVWIQDAETATAVTEIITAREGA